MLSYKDYQTLEWLSENNGIADAHEFTAKILTRLEEDYKVNRNDLFEAILVENIPVNRVMLSEISNSFLVLTPQWLYDGFLQEGTWKEKTEIVHEGKTYLIQRNKEEENKLLQFLESLHANFAKQMNGYFYLSFADAQKKQWFAKVYHKLLDMEIEVAGMDMLETFPVFFTKISTEINIKEDEGDVLKIEI